MGLAIRNAGVLRPITSLKVKHLGVVRALKTLRVRHGGSLRTIANFVPFSVGVSPPFASSVAYSATPINMFSGPITCAPNGGIAPFTYAWTKISGDTLQFVGSSTAPSVEFYQGVGPGFYYSAVYRCTVTDALGQSAFGETLVVLENQGGF